MSLPQFDATLVLLTRGTVPDTYKLEVRDLSNASDGYLLVKEFTYTSDVEATQEDLVAFGSSVFIAPHNKVLSLIGGIWYLSDFDSRVPAVLISDRNNSAGSRPRGYIRVRTAGGVTEGLVFRVNGVEINVPVLGSDTAEQIAFKVKIELESSPALPNQSITLSPNTQAWNMVTRQYETVPANTLLTITGNSFGFSSEAEIEYVSGSSEILVSDVVGAGATLGYLIQETRFWYKARMIYRDGHRTTTGFPVFYDVSTTSNRRVWLQVRAELDIDDNPAGVELFRKTGDGDWFLVKRILNPEINPLGYIEIQDDGLPEIGGLDEQVYIFTEEHRAHEVVRDRYVRGNVRYPELNPPDVDFEVGTAPSTGDETIPPNTEVALYYRGRGSNGLLTLHEQAGVLRIGPYNASEKVFDVVQTGVDPAYDQLALYAQYKFGDGNFTEFGFETQEIYNINVPSIESVALTGRDDTQILDKPANPHVLLGWRYVMGPVNSGTLTANVRIYDRGWDTAPKATPVISSDYFLVPVVRRSSTLVGGLPADIDVQVPGFGRIRYHLKYYRSGAATCVYEMAALQGIKTTVVRGDVRLRMIREGSAFNLSDTLPDTDYYGLNVRAVSVLDRSLEEPVLYLHNTSNFFCSTNSRVYLVLETGTPYDSFTRQNNVAGYSQDYDKNQYRLSTSFVQNRYVFRLDGLSETTFGEPIDPTPITTTVDRVPVTTFVYPYGLVNNKSVTERGGPLILLESSLQNGQQTVIRWRPPITGWKRVMYEGYLKWEYRDDNILETLVSAADFVNDTSTHQNRLIWSDPVSQDGASGARTFVPTNYLNIPFGQGQILALRYVGTRLLVFCEYGVAVVLVGELPAQSPSGTITIESAQFLNSPNWTIENAPAIKRRSIAVHRSYCFFSDGRDIWLYQFGQGIQNLTNRIIPLNPDSEQYGTFDTRNNEYRISSDGVTWSYCIDLSAWSGPHDYVGVAPAGYGDVLFDVVNKKVVRHNTGQTWAGRSYDTVIESVAVDLAEASIVKRFRKMYIDVQGDAVLHYGREEDTPFVKDLSTVRSIQGMKQVGVAPEHTNTRRLFWKMVSHAPDFLLRLFSVSWDPRARD